MSIAAALATTSLPVTTTHATIRLSPPPEPTTTATTASRAPVKSALKRAPETAKPKKPATSPPKPTAPVAEMTDVQIDDPLGSQTPSSRSRSVRSNSGVSISTDVTDSKLSNDDEATLEGVMGDSSRYEANNGSDEDVAVLADNLAASVPIPITNGGRRAAGNGHPSSAAKHNAAEDDNGDENDNNSEALVCWNGPERYDDHNVVGHLNTREVVFWSIAIADVVISLVLIIINMSSVMDGVVTTIPVTIDTNLPAIGNEGVAQSVATRYPVHMGHLIHWASTLSFFIHFSSAVFSAAGIPIHVTSTTSLQSLSHNMTIVPLLALMTGTSVLNELIYLLVVTLCRSIFLIIARYRHRHQTKRRWRNFINIAMTILLMVFTWGIRIATLAYGNRAADYKLLFSDLTSIQLVRTRVGGAIACIALSMVFSMIADIIEILSIFFGFTEARGSTVLMFTFNLPVCRFLTLSLLQTAAILKKSY